MSFCQVGLLFQQHYVWLSESNKLPWSFPACSLPSRWRTGNHDSLLPNLFHYKQFLGRWCRINLHCSCKDLCSWKPFQGQFPGGTGRWVCWRVIWMLWTVLSSGLHWKSASLCRELDWAPHLCIDLLLLFSLELAVHAQNSCCPCREMEGCNCMSGRCFSAAVSRNRKVKMLLGWIGPKSNTKVIL